MGILDNKLAYLNSTDAMERYFCTWDKFSGKFMTATNETIDTEWEFTCDFPYVPKGFAGDGEEGFGDVDLKGDCSVTYASVHGGAYTTKCLIYLVINLILLIINGRWLQIFAAKRAAQTKNKGVRSTNEQLCVLCFATTFFHLIISIDIDTFAGTIPYIVNAMLLGAMGSLMLSCAVLLVVSWVTIVDGGKAKTTPDWATKFSRISFGLILFTEVVLAFTECIITGDNGAYDGSIDAVKGFLFAGVAASWATVCAKYGMKIAAMLKGGAADNKQSAQIQKFMYGCMSGLVVATLYRAVFALPLFGYVLKTGPVCELGMVNPANVTFLFIQVMIVKIQAPSNPKKQTHPSGGSGTTTTTTTEP